MERLSHGAWWIARHLKILFTKWSKPEKDKHISLLCGILKYDTNTLTYKTEIDS